MSGTILIAGGGIGGLTAALALASRGFRVSIFEQSAQASEVGAGIQLSPNASRVLLALGLGESLRPVVSDPVSLVVRSAASGRPIVEMPLGAAAQQRFGAPYWVVHRPDLHAALVRAAEANSNIRILRGVRVENFAVRLDSVTIYARCGPDRLEEPAMALIGADGLWSAVRGHLDPDARPRFRHRTAWRALVPADRLPAEMRAPRVQLWLGHDAHLVHYPVAAGSLVNLVAIAGDRYDAPGWDGEGSHRDLLARFPRPLWADEARAVLQLSQVWQTWSLYDLPPLRRWGEGPVTLLGDAAHAMLPFLAQGAAMAIEDAAVLAECVARSPANLSSALRNYERARRRRCLAVQRAARGNDTVYHLAGAAALARNLGMRALGGRRLIGRYGWIYGWRPPGTPGVESAANASAAVPFASER